MLFASLPYAIFLLIVLLVGAAIPSRGLPAFLLAASLLFYAWGDPVRLPLLAIVIVLAHRGGLALSRSASRVRLWTFVGLLLAPLLYVKYYGWTAELIRGVLGSAEPHRIPPLAATVPIGISFFTFQAIAYVIDVSLRRVEAERRLDRVALFLAFFPTVLAGPIERAGHLAPQLTSLRTGGWATRADWAHGVSLILKGLLLKLVFADNFSVFVDGVYSTLATQPSGDVALACYLYSAQLYCDFYGYTLIATGSAALFGVQLSSNFEHPYLSTNIADFWRRWHISLSTWLRDYVFFPLGGLRRPLTRYRNVMVTMLVCGLWHGAGLKFVLWGGLHGLALVGQQAFRSATAGTVPRWPASRQLGGALGLLLTFHFVTASWILFRADDLAGAQIVGGKVAAWLWSPSVPGHSHAPFYYRLGVALVVLELVDYWLDLARVFRLSPAIVQVAGILLWFCCLYFAPLTSVGFIYFRF